ncbi:hypothetical protein L228DRAFT_248785 [Xylona heveae TC161]|uniref:Uncharacterized protein n=1 Tax=Xylona heveae (strain CBS 132557 / TC161) TaxID=1328760 RepID=A0A165FJ08_XYLHT|nr:hypothetical protein L228DRAFT_248785 [Xylona heveae TC161]KZF21033.1 hypothetical protein L228DRAFT_248785 [Xylona heveae TC161]
MPNCSKCGYNNITGRYKCTNLIKDPQDPLKLVVCNAELPVSVAPLSNAPPPSKK